RARRSGKLVALGHAHDQIALELLRGLVAGAQRVANEPHALREEVILDLATEIVAELLGQLVLVACALAVGLRQVVRVCADSQHLCALRLFTRSPGRLRVPGLGMQGGRKPCTDRDGGESNGCSCAAHPAPTCCRSLSVAPA